MSIKISTPKKVVKRVKFGTFDGTVTMNWSANFGQERTASFVRAQKFIDSSCIRYMSPYTPFITGVLEKSATLGTVVGSGRIKQIAPQARYLYYGRLMISPITGSAWSKGESKVLTDQKLKYTKAFHPSAGPQWFEKMKKNHKKQILIGAASILGGKAK